LGGGAKVPDLPGVQMDDGAAERVRHRSGGELRIRRSLHRLGSSLEGEIEPGEDGLSVLARRLLAPVREVEVELEISMPR